MGVTTQMFGDVTNFLSIPSAGPSNQGNYTCIAKNNAGFDMYTSQLVVNGIKNYHVMKIAWSNIHANLPSSLQSLLTISQLMFLNNKRLSQ